MLFTSNAMVSSSTEPKFFPLLSSSNQGATLPGATKGLTEIPLKLSSVSLSSKTSFKFIGSLATNFGLKH